MNPYYLATKLQIPPPPQRAVQRTHLLNALEDGIARHKLIWVSAPAGYGKTTLLAQWAHASRFPVVWFSIGEEDNDPDRFLRYLIKGWEKLQPQVMESPLGLLLGALEPERDAVLSAFVNLAGETPNHLVFILDDYHLITEPSIHQALTFLLDHLPPNLHFVLADRGEPPLPLARYRAHHDLLEFHAADLSFMAAETQAFMQEVMQLDLSVETVVRLQEQMEGWAAGLQVMALSLQRRLSGSDPMVEPVNEQVFVSGRHRFIADYFREDVLAGLPAATRNFLLQTSILERLNRSLCESVTGQPGSQMMLETLERQNLFLVPLDESRDWFRYHHLFAEFLQGELTHRHPDQVPDLHHRAARWYLAHDLPEQALHHAVKGNDFESAVEVFTKYTNVKLNSGELLQFKRWLDTLPQEWLAREPMFRIAQASWFAFTGAMEACMRCLNDVERNLAQQESEQNRKQQAKVTAIRCAIACMQNDLAQAQNYASRALLDLAGEDPSFLHLVYGALGDAYRLQGLWQQARDCYLKVLDLPYSPSYRLHSVHAYGALADLELRQGRLREAAANWRSALQGMADQAIWGGVPLPLTGWVHIRMSEILYEWNKVSEAADHLFRGLERAELGGDVRSLIAGYLLAVRIKLTEGDFTGAGEYLEHARPLVESARFPEWNGRFERMQVELWLAEANLRAALKWASQVQRNGPAEGSEEEQLALARVLIAKGEARSLQEAKTLLQKLLQMAEGAGWAGVMVEAMALHALAHARSGDQTSALVTLERSLRLAEAEGYVRRFADVGLAMGRLLQEARARAVMPEYVATLLAAFAPDPAFATSPQMALPEALSEREQEVLQRLAAGLTNREIAEALIISPETVKKHTSSIYGKLGVRTRTEAVARARELQLLD